MSKKKQKQQRRKKSVFPRKGKFRQGNIVVEHDAYNSPFKHFLMPLRHGRPDKVYRAVALLYVEILAPGPSGARIGVKTWVPMKIPQGTPRELKRDFFMWDGALDYESIRGLFLNNSMAMYANLIFVQGIYLLKTEIGRKRIAKKVLKKGGGFKKTHAKKRGQPHRAKSVRGRNKTSRRKGTR